MFRNSKCIINNINKSDIKTLLKKYDLKPKKMFGQNFLVSKNALSKIIKAADIKKTDVILEIGSGLGVLTVELAKLAKKVIAVEKDREMARILKEILAEKKIKNVEVIEGDILKMNIPDLFKPYKSRCFCFTKIRDPDSAKPTSGLKPTTYKLVSNIPYYITAPIIRKFLESPEAGLREIVLLVQKEVAQRICAEPPKMSLLAVSVQFYAEPKIISYVKKESFWPKPKVDSAIIKISPQPSALSFQKKEFFKVVKAGFAHPRKQLAGNLSKGLEIPKEKITEILKKSNIKPEQRAETLAVEDWKRLTSRVSG